MVYFSYYYDFAFKHTPFGFRGINHAYITQLIHSDLRSALHICKKFFCDIITSSDVRWIDKGTLLTEIYKFFCILAYALQFIIWVYIYRKIGFAYVDFYVNTNGKRRRNDKTEYICSLN